MATSETIELFEIAQGMAKSKTNLSNEQLLTLYKYYKQATCGDCNIGCPGVFDPRGRAKWNAWNSIKGMKLDDAMCKYCDYVLKL